MDSGHSVLAVPVPQVDTFVRERTAHYDADYLADDPRFGQAHVTVLGPWVRQPSVDDLAQVGRIASGTEPFGYRLERLGTFPNGIIHLHAEPAVRFRTLTQAVWDAFPDHPPYEGQFADSVPHVTLDAVGPGVEESRVRSMLGETVPVACRAEVVQLQWWQAGHCHVHQSWRLGETAGGVS